MYSTTTYIYQQRTRVLLPGGCCGIYSPLRYEPVYAKKLTINLGVDNVLLFSMVNQEEKPVNVTGQSFRFRLLNQQGTKILYEAPMTILSPTTGQVRITIPTNDLLEVQAQPASYSITAASGNLNQAVLTDAQAGARAPVDIVSSVYPRFVPSAELTIPTIELSNQVSYGGTDYQNYPDWAGQYWSGNGSYYNSWANTEYYSSFIVPTSALTTIQMDLVGYTGTIKAQWAENYQSLWYNVTESTTYYDYTGTIHMNVVGWYPLLRLGFNNSIFATPAVPGVPALAYAVCNGGVLTSIVVTNGGSGYLAPPKIDIMGNGAGAEARAIMSDTYPEGHPQAGMGYGTVVGIEVTNGGSGYWPIPSGAVNTAAYPVAPQNQGAFVAITTGFVTNLWYR